MMADEDSEDDISIVEPPTVVESQSNQGASVSKRKSPVWAYFTIKNMSDKDWVSCDLCDKKVKTKDSGTSNLFGHLKSSHPLKYADIAPASAKKLSHTTKPASSSYQMTLSEACKRKYERTSDEYKQLTASVTKYLVSGV